MSTPLAYWAAVAVGTVITIALCLGCRHRPGPWVRWAGRAIAATLAADAVVFVARPMIQGGWSVHGSLPLALCDVALVVAAAACWFPSEALLVELTYFWGLTGTLQAVLTPDLAVGFPHLEFFEFVVGHIGIVVAACYLVVGLRRVPRPGSVTRVFLITVGYASILGLFDWLTGSNYMFLAAPPQSASLLSVLGHWPWYILSAAGVALVMFLLLDMPFRRSRRLQRAQQQEPYAAQLSREVSPGRRTRPG